MPTLDLASITQQLALDPLARGLILLDAAELAADAFPRLDTDRPALVFGLTAVNVQTVTRTLRVNYPAAHPIALVQPKRIQQCPLDSLVAEKNLARNTVLYVSPLAQASSPLTLANIMARLRAPIGGCPWDLEQTHESITRSLVEETYEVIETISDGDMPHLMEELGDLFLHVLFQTQIARDENEFALSDVGAELAAKLVRRHPHVFGNEQAKDAGVVLENWEKIKQAEKASKGETAVKGTLETGIPRHLPALTRSQKVAERARRQKTAVTPAALPPSLARSLQQKRGAARERAYGDLLLALAAFGQEQGIDAESALNAATKRFVEKTDSRVKK